MHGIKQTLLTATLTLILALTGMMALAPQASALTEGDIKKCYVDHNGKSLTLEQDVAFRTTTCFAPGEACMITVERLGGTTVRTVNCENPDRVVPPPGGGEDDDFTGDLGKLECSILPSSICSAADNPNLDDSGLWKLLILGFNILTAGVGIVAVGAIVYAGFLYTTAQGNADQVKKALEMIRNTVIGLALFAGMFALVNFFVPGGIFKTSATTLDRVLASQSTDSQHIATEEQL